MPEISIIVRTKNEDFEVILVDNASIDQTIQVARRFPLAAVVNIDTFLRLGCITSTTLIRSGKLVGGKVGILPVDHSRHALRLKDVT